MRTLSSSADCSPCRPSCLAAPSLRPRLRIVLFAAVWSAAAGLPLCAAHPQEPSDPAKPLPTGPACYVAPPLSTLTVDVALPAGTLPENIAAECAATTPPVLDRRLADAWATTDYHWSAAGMCHRPLYFEEINAERYGYTPSYVFQPVLSAVRFFFTIPALPYKMMIERPRRCSYTLGHYRPGSCAPRRWHRLPLRISVGVAEAAVVVGLVFLIP